MLPGTTEPTHLTLWQRALLVAANSHAAQLDKCGVPYVLHCIAVSEKMEGEEAKAVALMHDVLEDTPWTEEMLRELFSEEPHIIDAVVVLTHKVGGVSKYATYKDYVAACAQHQVARRVKIADIRHNSLPERLAWLGENERESLLKRYESALAILLDRPTEGDQHEQQ